MYYLEANHIVKQYASHRALDDVTVHVPRNGIYGLLGPNGAGKTTLIRIINQITAPDEGEVLIDGRPLHPSDVEHIGYLPEERGLYKKMKVGEQILYLAQLKGLSRKAAKESMDYWLNKFDIKGWEKKKIEELSKGMQQKIQFITTVMHNPQLLIFDEPSRSCATRLPSSTAHTPYCKARWTTFASSTRNTSSRSRYSRANCKATTSTR